MEGQAVEREEKHEMMLDGAEMMADDGGWMALRGGGGGGRAGRPWTLQPLTAAIESQSPQSQASAFVVLHLVLPSALTARFRFSSSPPPLCILHAASSSSFHLHRLASSPHPLSPSISIDFELSVVLFPPSPRNFAVPPPFLRRSLSPPAPTRHFAPLWPPLPTSPDTALAFTMADADAPPVAPTTSEAPADTEMVDVGGDEAAGSSTADKPGESVDAGKSILENLAV